jgi:hypothetical protein
MITVDAGGSNGWRLRVWKVELQKFADESGLTIAICHFPPPGTSKWNKIEHRLFSFISSNWRGEPLRDYETIVNLIAKTTTAKGLRMTCRLDHCKYPTAPTVRIRAFLSHFLRGKSERHRCFTISKLADILVLPVRCVLWLTSRPTVICPALAIQRTFGSSRTLLPKT